MFYGFDDDTVYASNKPTPASLLAHPPLQPLQHVVGGLVDLHMALYQAILRMMRPRLLYLYNLTIALWTVALGVVTAEFCRSIITKYMIKPQSCDGWVDSTSKMTLAIKNRNHAVPVVPLAHVLCRINCRLILWKHYCKFSCTDFGIFSVWMLMAVTTRISLPIQFCWFSTVALRLIEIIFLSRVRGTALGWNRHGQISLEFKLEC